MKFWFPNEIMRIILQINKDCYMKKWKERLFIYRWELDYKLTMLKPIAWGWGIWSSGKIGRTRIKYYDRKKYVEGYTQFTRKKSMLTKTFLKSDLVRAELITIIGLNMGKLLRNKQELC